MLGDGGTTASSIKNSGLTLFRLVLGGSSGDSDFFDSIMMAAADVAAVEVMAFVLETVLAVLLACEYPVCCEYPSFSRLADALGLMLVEC